MSPEPGRFLITGSRNDRRRQRQSQRRRRRLALIVAVILVAAAVFVWMVILPGSKNPVSSTSTTIKTAGATSTSVSQLPSSSTTSTSLGAPTTTSTATSQANSTLTLSAQLSGQNEVPAVVTSASGTLTLTVAADSSSVHYVLIVSNISNVTVARLHEGKAGATGPTILTLFGGPTKSGVFTGVLAQGTLTAADLGGPLKGKSVQDLVTLMKAGSVYLNVGTTAHVLGEIRGQVK